MGPRKLLSGQTWIELADIYECSRGSLMGSRVSRVIDIGGSGRDNFPSYPDKLPGIGVMSPSLSKGKFA